MPPDHGSYGLIEKLQEDFAPLEASDKRGAASLHRALSRQCTPPQLPADVPGLDGRGSRLTLFRLLGNAAFKDQARCRDGATVAVWRQLAGRFHRVQRVLNTV